MAPVYLLASSLRVADTSCSCSASALDSVSSKQHCASAGRASHSGAALHDTLPPCPPSSSPTRMSSLLRVINATASSRDALRVPRWAIRTPVTARLCRAAAESPASCRADERRTACRAAAAALLATTYAHKPPPVRFMILEAFRRHFRPYTLV